MLAHSAATFSERAYERARTGNPFSFIIPIDRNAKNHCYLSLRLCETADCDNRNVRSGCEFPWTAA
jgi:hypothetical protein